MHWKRFIIFFSFLGFLFFPYNIIGCGPEDDPYDYYVSFFQNNVSEVKGYQPFYYTNLRFLYTDDDNDKTAFATSAEWIKYFKSETTAKDAYLFICEYGYQDIFNLLHHIQLNSPLSLPDSVLQNSVTKYFLRTKDQEALKYILFAKKTEPFVTQSADSWEPINPDISDIQNLVNEGESLYHSNSINFIGPRYLYQLARLAFHAGQPDRCIQYCDRMLGEKTAHSSLNVLTMSLKAGALFRKKNYPSAALIYSNNFAGSDLKRMSNYVSFSWCIRRLSDSSRTACLASAKSTEEKSNMLGLFLLGSPQPEAKSISAIANQNPGLPMLEILMTREVNKIEENYFSPQLTASQGGVRLFEQNIDMNDLAKNNSWLENAVTLIPVCHALSHGKGKHNRALYAACAAQLSYIIQDYKSATRYLNDIKFMHPSPRIADQVQLTRLLVSINTQETIDSAFESALLPSIVWLCDKSKNISSPKENMYNYNNWPEGEGQWYRFYRNVFSEILAKRYHEQGMIAKEALCIGVTERRYFYQTEEFTRSKMQIEDLLAMRTIMRSKNQSAWNNFLASHMSMPNDKVTEVIATSYARDFQFLNALKWISKVKDQSRLKLKRNPFGELIKDDQEDIYDFDRGQFNKISFLKEMNRLQDKANQNIATSADLYKLAVGYYNMTYYGRAWEMTDDYRSSVDGYYIPKKALPFQKEYYGCFTAEKYYRSALNKSQDNNFKSRCLFMIAKCAQKRVFKSEPDRYWFQSNLNASEKQERKLFSNSSYFPELTSKYSKTTFFTEAYNTCSYLKDFVDKQH